MFRFHGIWKYSFSSILTILSCFLNSFSINNVLCRFIIIHDPASRYPRERLRYCNVAINQTLSPLSDTGFPSGTITIKLLATTSINIGTCFPENMIFFSGFGLQSVSRILAEFRHNKIVQLLRENCFNVCRQLQRKVRSPKHDV